jgi:hypothetical protein
VRLLVLVLLAGCGGSSSSGSSGSSSSTEADEVADWVCKQALIEAAELVEPLPEKIAHADLEQLEAAHAKAVIAAEKCEQGTPDHLAQARSMRDGLSHAISVKKAIRSRAGPPAAPPAAPPPPSPSPEAAPPAR